MSAIRIVELLETPVLLAPEKGTRLKEAIASALASSQKVDVDFRGYQFISSTFLNHSFGQLCIDLQLSKAGFHERVLVTGLTEDDSDELELTLFNAQRRRELLGQEIDPEKFYSSRIPA